MRVLGLAALVLGLAITGYLVVASLNEGTKVQRMLEAGSSPLADAPTQSARDLSRRGLEQRLSPILDRARERAEQANRATAE